MYDEMKTQKLVDDFIEGIPYQDTLESMTSMWPFYFFIGMAILWPSIIFGMTLEWPWNKPFWHDTMEAHILM